jgi:ABC-type amino acid transport substrate-binding protein
VFLVIPLTASSQQTWQIVTENFPPYFSENLPQGGWLLEMTQSALQTQNINSEIEFTTWDRALRLLEKKKKTAILGAYYSPARNEIFYYSRPLGFSHTGIFKRKNSIINYNGTVESLEPYSIGKKDSAFVSQEFSKNTNLAITTTKNLSISMYLLQKGRIDLVAGTKEAGEYWLKNKENLSLNSNEEVHFLQPYLASHNLYLIVSQSNPQAKKYIQKLNTGMRIIINNGTAAKILEKHNFIDSDIASYIAFIKQETD